LTQRWLRKTAAPDEETSHFGLKFAERTIESAATRIENDRPRATQSGQLEPSRFAHTPAKAVPHHGFAERAGRCEANVHAGTLDSGEEESCKAGTSVPCTVIVNLAEVAGSEQPYTFGKAVFLSVGYEGCLIRRACTRAMQPWN